MTVCVKQCRAGVYGNTHDIRIYSEGICDINDTVRVYMTIHVTQ